MLIDYDSADPVIPTFPIPIGKPKERMRAGKLTINIYERPSHMSNNPVRVLMAASVMRGDECIFTANIEADDLKALSSYLSVPIGELRKDYGVEGFLGNGMVRLYSGSVREDLGRYFGDDPIPFLVDLVLDSFDCPSDPVKIP